LLPAATARSGIILRMQKLMKTRADAKYPVALIQVIVADPTSSRFAVFVGSGS
jgi:hypothetical protein